MARKKLQSWLEQRGLALSTNKTHIRHLTQGFDFLDFHIRDYPIKNREQSYIFLAKPSKSSIQHFRHSIRQALKRAQAWPIQSVINLLNPIIRNWSYYFRIGSATKTFATLDQWMWIKQKRFVIRRHSTKTGDGDTHVIGDKYQDEKTDECSTIKFQVITY